METTTTGNGSKVAEAVPVAAGKLAVRPPAPVERIPPPLRPDNGPQGYEGASTGQLTKEETAALMAPFKDEEHELKPTEAGEVFVSQVHVRHRLNTVLGIGQWALIPVQTEDGRQFYSEGKGDRETVLMRGRLFVRGHFISDHIGEQHLANDRMTYATACEAAQSDTLTRCAKDLSVGWECWDKRWCDEWRKKYAVRVWVKRGKGDGQTVWRRKDSPPLRGEVAVDAGSSERAAAGADQTIEPLINKQQIADVWAIVTETFPRQKAQQMAKEVIARFGFKKADEITVAQLPAVIAAIREAGE